MEVPYIYYIPIYPDDDCSETLMHLFSGEPGLDIKILALLKELDHRERKGEGVNYIQEFEDKIGLKRVLVHQLHRDRNRFFTAQPK
ncbi:hypothetical protein Syn7502_01304 [Synechococcus sp. PCC 7502]|uniref:hypothetical protein n=1 Tax=Synechococcus sp. PCC 7502 TaxID=1173263 RepID=UPI00029F96D5|nr:hypothetical protein [Synechococcus sp. PCC 7502]AFY73398.1 hypothetical protein Syn7502_01304 [Synechococcus sp. PCC 7502]